MSLTFLEVAVPRCSAEDFDGEIVAINLDTGRYFSIKDAAAIIWHDLAGGHAVETIRAAVGDDAALVAAIDHYIGEVSNEGLMRPAAVPAAAAAALQSAPGMAHPSLESFGDMESLLLLDPVHEVDDSEGWPLPRNV
jgi:hypothetical protein